MPGISKLKAVQNASQKTGRSTCYMVVTGLLLGCYWAVTGCYLVVTGLVVTGLVLMGFYIVIAGLLLDC